MFGILVNWCSHLWLTPKTSIWLKRYSSSSVLSHTSLCTSILEVLAYVWVGFCMEEFGAEIFRPSEKKRPRTETWQAKAKLPTATATLPGGNAPISGAAVKSDGPAKAKLQTATAALSRRNALSSGAAVTSSTTKAQPPAPPPALIAAIDVENHINASLSELETGGKTAAQAILTKAYRLFEAYIVQSSQSNTVKWAPIAKD